MKKNTKGTYFFYILPYLVINFLAFGSSYLHIDTGGIYFIFLSNVIVSVVIGTKLRTSVAKKIIYVLIATVINSIIGALLVISTMYIPGSKEHNYVMYEVCFPAIKKHYGIPVDQPFSNGEVNKDGWGKWWYQHTECEQNVYQGKGPIFSENPPGFIPVSQ